MALFQKRQCQSDGLGIKLILPQCHLPTPKNKTTFAAKTANFPDPLPGPFATMKKGTSSLRSEVKKGLHAIWRLRNVTFWAVVFFLMFSQISSSLVSYLFLIFSKILTFLVPIFTYRNKNGVKLLPILSPGELYSVVNAEKLIF